MSSSPEEYNAVVLPSVLSAAVSALAIAGSSEQPVQPVPPVTEIQQPSVVQAEKMEAAAAAQRASQLSMAELAVAKAVSAERLKRSRRTIIPPLLRRIGGCESNGSATAKINYQAENPSSTASGGYQFLDTTWNHFRGYARAKNAPPATQDRYALMTFKKQGTGPWLSSRSCWG